ncbi:hypothetical protein [Marseilla massiliensis]|uniref:Lipoprotein n=1 Tax=Marseilla massiliensis TaxID=1841864 RepID=A0A938WMV2_9BACT|nr:hypothetical protein [Marseilla massiliensis]MBM6661716.1 hypothetical protein [Marseilla massiliensis]
MRLLALMACALLMAGCATTKNEAYRARHDVTHTAAHRHDSTMSVATLRDSISIVHKGDTVTKYVERTRYRLSTRADTVFCYRLRTDTLVVVRSDSVVVHRPLHAGKRLRWYTALHILAACAASRPSCGLFSFT